jgi:small subunit ribosomal protein S8
MDKVGNLFSAILNAQERKKTSVHLSFTKFNQNILSALHAEGYIEGFQVSNSPAYLVATLSHTQVFQIQRVSRPGKRVYVKLNEIGKTKRGLGILLLSTSKGIMSDRDAQFFHLGGEALCHIF